MIFCQNCDSHCIYITVDNVKIVQYAPDDGMPQSKDLNL